MGQIISVSNMMRILVFLMVFGTGMGCKKGSTTLAPVDWSAWSAWSGCCGGTDYCLGATYTRNRTCLNELGCEGATEEELSCQCTGNCPVSPTDWIQPGPQGHLYYAPDMHLSWDDSVQYCDSIGTRLAEFSDLDEFLSVSFWADNMNDGENYWLGATDVATEGTWLWNSDGTELDLTVFTPELAWGVDQPNNGEPSTNVEHFLMIGFQYDYLLGDKSDNGINLYKPLCQIEATTCAI